MAERPVEGYGEQIRAAAAYVEDARTMYQCALAARNRIIVEAVDNGYSGHQAARDAGVKQPHIVRILSKSQPEDEIELLAG